jgi:hypothetical protein
MKSNQNTKAKKGGHESTIANKIIELVTKSCELVHNKQKEPFAIIHSNGIRKIYSINSKSFVELVASEYYAETKSSISDASLKTAISTLNGKANFEGEEVDIHLRVAKTEKGYWLDLCNDRWEAVLITEAGWTVMSGEQVPLFCRSNSMQSIPTPVSGGSLESLWKIVNIPIGDRLIVLCWLLECLRPDTPHVVLEIIGQQGSAKSTTQQFLKQLVDPNAANLRTAPKNAEDLWIGARNCHVVSFENLSYLSQQYQDALCVLATGGALATRTLFTNLDETIVQLCRPVVLNGISVVITAQDLLDRCIHLELPRVVSRLLSKDVAEDFEKNHAQIVGALLDQFVLALRELAAVDIPDEEKPRMVDFAYLGEAVFIANGYEPGEFLRRYKEMRQKGVHRTIEAFPIGIALFSFLQDRPDGWSGQLLELLSLLNPKKPTGEPNWPRSAKSMGDALRRLSPALRTIGFECSSSQKTGGNIIWKIKPLET